MDATEVLHTPRYTSEDGWKCIPVENDRVESRAISTFPKFSLTLFTVDDLQVLPGAP